jgi:hypothetical protein
VINIRKKYNVWAQCSVAGVTTASEGLKGIPCEVCQYSGASTFQGIKG